VTPAAAKTKTLGKQTVVEDPGENVATRRARVGLVYKDVRPAETPLTSHAIAGLSTPMHPPHAPQLSLNPYAHHLTPMAHPGYYPGPIGYFPTSSHNFMQSSSQTHPQTPLYYPNTFYSMANQPIYHAPQYQAPIPIPGPPFS
jgi:hypothetical protein